MTYRNLVDLIARAGARAAQVVRNLLDFARKEEYSLRLTDLNETVERALELIQHEFLARGIDLEFKEDPYLPSILASQDHLQSVWLNLLLNAMDSLDKSPGEINIDTQKVGNEIQVYIYRQRQGNSTRKPDANIRTILHHQSTRTGNWLGALRQSQDHQAARRPYPGRKPGGIGEQIHGHPANSLNASPPSIQSQVSVTIRI